MATGQTQLFDGIHLPDLVGALGAGPNRGRFATWRRGRLPLPAHPALQGAFAGQIFEIGMQLAQANEQVGCSPRRMFLMQKQGLAYHLGRRGGLGWHIGGRECRATFGLEPLTKMPHRARSQEKFARDGGGAGASLSERLDTSPHQRGNRCGHGSLHESEKVKISVHGNPIT